MQPIWPGNQWSDRNGQRFTDDIFWYTVGPGVNGAIGNLAASATANTQFNVQADSNFEWNYTTWTGTVHAGAEPLTDNYQLPITLLLTDGGSGRNLFNQAMLISTFAGIGREPYVNCLKRIFMGKSTVNLFWTSLDATNQWDNISITFHGRKIFTLS